MLPFADIGRHRASGVLLMSQHVYCHYEPWHGLSKDVAGLIWVEGVVSSIGRCLCRNDVVGKLKKVSHHTITVFTPLAADTRPTCVKGFHRVVAVLGYTFLGCRPQQKTQNGNSIVFSTFCT
jgi:hypothetical protein